MSRKVLRARYVVPVDSPVIEDGAVAMDGGRIAAVGRAEDLADRSATDFGDAVICPGFVNAHTHFELSHLAGIVPPTLDFVAWLRRLYQLALADPPVQTTIEAAVRCGIEQSIRGGVTLIGDITRHPGWTRPMLGGAAIRAVSFGEVVAIGRLGRLLSERLAAAASRDHESPTLRAGISPHAPYTLDAAGLRACAERGDHRLCIHVAETLSEEEFTLRGTGPLADYLGELGVWRDGPPPLAGCRPIELLRNTGVLACRTLLAHANYVSNDDLALIAESGASVVYCPRTHAAFGHPPHRFRDMLAAGITVAIGTDSLASNPSLSILDELRYVHRVYPSFSVDGLLAMGTLAGAHALGAANDCGSLSVGKFADLVVIPLETRRAGRWWSMLESGLGPVSVYCGGRPMFSAHGGSTGSQSM